MKVKGHTREQQLGPVLQALPKVELHLHVDCSLSYDVVSRLDPSVSEEEFLHEFVAPDQCASLAQFLTCAPRGFQLMQSVGALRSVIEDVFQQLASDNVIYAELRFAPLLHLERGLTPDQVVSAVERATDDCIRATGIEARIILCTLRHFTYAQSWLTAQLVHRFRGSTVVGLDIAGDEAGFPIDAHIPAFRFAGQEGIHITAHAGESVGANSIWDALRFLEPSRIGHGVRCVEDPVLLEHLRTNGIHLELCPTSNIKTSAWPTYADHPIDRLFRQNVSLSINTDTRTIANINLNSEYSKIHQEFGWNLGDFRNCNRAGLESAFVEPTVKKRLLALLESQWRCATAKGETW